MSYSESFPEQETAQKEATNDGGLMTVESSIFNETQVRLSPWDAIKVLFGKSIHISTKILTANVVSVLGTEQSIYVDSIIRKTYPASISGNGKATS